MKKMIAVVVVIVTGLMGFVLTGCVGFGDGTVKAKDIGDPAAGQRVLMASSGSGFKDKVLEALTTQLSGEGVFVRVVPLENLAAVDTKGFVAIVLANTVKVGHIDQRVVDYLNKTANDQRIIVFSTYGGSGAPELGVDAVAGPSTDQGVETTVAQLLGLVKQRFVK